MEHEYTKQHQQQQRKRRWSDFSSRILIRQLSWRRRTYPEVSAQKKRHANILLEETATELQQEQSDTTTTHPTSSWPPITATSTASSTLSFFRRALPTISSVTRSTSSIFTVTGFFSHYAPSRKSFAISSSIPPPPVFHAQSLLFLFGFLFFPCWWIGAFCIDYDTTSCSSYTHRWQRATTSAATATLRRPSTVHPSMIANGRASSQLWATLKNSQIQNLQIGQHQQQQQQPCEPESWRRERELFRRWNRYLSFISLVLLAVIIAMLVWYQIGVRNRWWRAVM